MAVKLRRRATGSRLDPTMEGLFLDLDRIRQALFDVGEKVDALADEHPTADGVDPDFNELSCGRVVAEKRVERRMAGILEAAGLDSLRLGGVRYDIDTPDPSDGEFGSHITRSKAVD